MVASPPVGSIQLQCVDHGGSGNLENGQRQAEYLDKVVLVLEVMMRVVQDRLMNRDKAGTR